MAVTGGTPGAPVTSVTGVAIVPCPPHSPQQVLFPRTTPARPKGLPVSRHHGLEEPARTRPFVLGDRAPPGGHSGPRTGPRPPADDGREAVTDCYLDVNVNRLIETSGRWCGPGRDGSESGS